MTAHQKSADEIVNRMIELAEKKYNCSQSRNSLTQRRKHNFGRLKNGRNSISE